MSFDRRFSLAQLMQSGYGKGISADSIGEISSEQGQQIMRTKTPWQMKNSVTVMPEKWTEGDSFLAKTLGYKVEYIKDGWGKRATYTKSLSRYTSPTVQQKLKQTSSTLTEGSLLKDVDIITDSLDLRGTSAISLPKLKSVWGNMTIDAGSSLKELGSLKNIAGKLTVIAKSKEDMQRYLELLGIMTKDGLAVTIKDGIHFIMKNYV